MSDALLLIMEWRNSGKIHYQASRRGSFALFYKHARSVAAPLRCINRT